MGNKTAAYDLLYLCARGIRGLAAEPERVERMELAAVLAESRRHHLSALAYEALRGLSGDGTLPLWQEAAEQALVKELLQDAEREELFRFCEAEGIWYMPMKGVVLKELYPAPGLRQMSDNDVLCDPAGRARLREWFARRGYRSVSTGDTDQDEYLKEPVLNFEIHAALTPEESPEAWREYYANPERLLLPGGTGRFSRRFSDEDFYIYMTAHARKHFDGGGTGLRSLIDEYVFLSRRAPDRARVDAGLEKLALTDFEAQLRALAMKLFAGERPEPLTARERDTLEYCLLSGAYGNVKNRAKNLLRRPGGLLRGLFPGRKFMADWAQKYSPFCARHPRLYLLPCLLRLLRALRRLMDRA